MAEIGTITTLFLTAAGLRLQAKVQAGRTPLILTRAKIGYGYLQDDMDLKSLTGPINEVPSHQTGEEGTTATVDLTRVYDDTQEGMAYVGISVKNGDNPRFFLREFDVFADDPDVGEICYGIANLGDEAPPISPYDGRNHIEYKYDLPTVIANADDVVANITLAADTPWDEYMSHKTNTYNPHRVTAAQTGAIPMSEKGSAGGVAELDASGTVPSSQLPSYVDDVIECNGVSAFPSTGESGKIYVDTVTNLSYRWSGSQYTEISPSIALGETSSTAYRGDRGAEAYRHSQQPHAPSNANYYEHPSSHSADIITETTERQFVTVTEKTAIAKISNIIADITTIQEKIAAIETAIDFDYVDLAVNITKTERGGGQSNFSITSASGNWDTTGYAADVVTEDTPKTDEFDGIMYIYASAVNRTVTVGLSVGRNLHGKVYTKATNSGTYTLRVYNTRS